MDKEQTSFFQKLMGGANHSVTEWVGEKAKGNFFTGSEVGTR